MKLHVDMACQIGMVTWKTWYGRFDVAIYMVHIVASDPEVCKYRELQNGDFWVFPKLNGYGKLKVGYMDM